MTKDLESFTIFSSNAKRLAKFYKDIVGLKVTFEAVMGEKTKFMNLK
jgi:catechol-2,3-dioxygenase